MTPKEKKAFVARMKKARKAAKGKKKSGGGKKKNSSRKKLEQRIEHLEKIIAQKSPFVSYSGTMDQEKFDLQQAKKKLDCGDW